MKPVIYPALGIARLGNSKDAFILATDPDDDSTPEDKKGNKLKAISGLKDRNGCIKRQGQLFKLRCQNGEELTLDSPGIDSIQWTVHLTNRKTVSISYDTIAAPPVYEDWNYDIIQGFVIPHPKINIGEKNLLHIDLGPRSIAGKNQSVGFDINNVPEQYPAVYPPTDVRYGVCIHTLGNLLTDQKGRLIVLGGFGNAGGNLLSTDKGTSLIWYEDSSEGIVYCTIKLTGKQTPVKVSAKILVTQPELMQEEFSKVH